MLVSWSTWMASGRTAREIAGIEDDAASVWWRFEQGGGPGLFEPLIGGSHDGKIHPADQFVCS
jgi:hypothetical protein